MTGIRKSFSIWNRHHTGSEEPASEDDSDNFVRPLGRSKTSPFPELDFHEPPLEDVKLLGYNDQTKNKLLANAQLVQDIRGLLPTRLQLFEYWTLQYSLDVHGASLHTLYRRLAEGGSISRGTRPFGTSSEIAIGGSGGDGGDVGGRGALGGEETTGYGGLGVSFGGGTATKSSAIKGRRPGYVLAVKDDHGNVFGAYVNEPFKATEGKRFTGNGDCFLWKSTKLTGPRERHHNDTSSTAGSNISHDDEGRAGSDSEVNSTTNRHNSVGHSVTDDYDDDENYRFQAYPYTGVNDFVLFCTSKFLSMGGGDGHYGLWIDDGLNCGVSERSLTFGNDPLSDRTKFRVINVEVWQVG